MTANTNIKDLIKQSQKLTGNTAHLDRLFAVKSLVEAPKSAEVNTALIVVLSDEEFDVANVAAKALATRMHIPRIYQAVEEVATGWNPTDWRTQEIARSAVANYWKSQLVVAGE